MAYERYTDRQRHADPDAQLYLRPDGSAYLNVGAVDEYFTKRGSPVESVAYYIDRDTSTLGMAIGDDGSDAFSVGHKQGSGATLNLAGTLRKAFDIPVDAIDERWEFDLTPADHDTVDVEVDLAPLVEATTAAVHCPECGLRCASENGLSTHQGRAHDIDASDLKALAEDETESVPEGDDSWKDIGSEGGESA